MYHRSSCVPGLLIGLALSLSATGLMAQSTPRVATESALETIFNPRRAPRARTMGLVQRNFLDLLEVGHSRLELALVVDGTDSMGGSIAGIQTALYKMLDDLHRYQENVVFQLVVYRDVGAASGACSFPLQTPMATDTEGNKSRSFTADRAVLRAGIKSIQGESGAPYFPELIDLGVQQALTELNWSAAEDVTRWLLVFGDAPPFEEGFKEEDSRAERRISTQQLVSTATRLGVKVNCVLCPSRTEDESVYQKVLPQTQRFMNQLATDTGGLMLDLSYPDIRNAVQQAASVQRVRYRKIGKITRESIAQARQEAQQAATLAAEQRRIRMAVLPHVPLTQLKGQGAFDPALPAVQVAAELRHRFLGIPGAEIKSPLSVERQVFRLQARGVRGTDLLPSLATALKVDYVVWGVVSQEDGRLQIQSSIYANTSGNELVQQVVRANDQLPVSQLTARLSSRIKDQIMLRNLDTRLVAALSLLEEDSPSDRRMLNPVAQTELGRTALLIGFEFLEKALAYPVGSPDGQSQLKQARKALERAQQEDQQNPLVALLLANTAFNEAQWLTQQGKSEEALQYCKQYSQALKSAFARRKEANFDYLQREIEADYALMIKKDYVAAAEIYQQLAELKPTTPLRSSQRAHWMLAGIHSGDWGVAESPAAKTLVDESKSRHHLIQILAHFAESSEAEFIRHNLRWDREKGENRFEHLPHVNRRIANAVR